MKKLLQLDNISKHYPQRLTSASKLLYLLKILTGKAEHNQKTVLSDINLEVTAGRSIGIIGNNGAGKSTLLKIISGIMEPSGGSVQRHCKFAMLIELGAGFDDSKTGYENIFLKAQLLGMSRKEVKQKLDSIIEFSGLGDNIHNPVRHYSSGMVVRLGFSICTAVSPELLITDEVLAVGDESFNKRCVQWIDNYLKNGGTLLMVTHSMYLVTRLCASTIWLKDGKIHLQGESHQVTQAYMSWHQEQRNPSKSLPAADPNNGRYHIKSLRCMDASQQEQSWFEYPADVMIEIVMAAPDGRAPVAGVSIVRVDRVAVYGVTSEQDQITATSRGDDEYVYTLLFKDIQLLPGKYEIRAHALDPEGIRVCDNQVIDITFTAKTQEVGMVRLQHEWI